MTIAEIERRILAIRSLAYDRDDDEKAHAREDDLRRDFLRWLIQEPQPVELVQQMAKLVLSTDDIKFARWCA